MNGTVAAFSIILVLLFSLLGVIVFSIVVSSNNASNFTEQLQTSNIKVIKGYIDSPSVRIPVSEYTFMQKATEIGTVYEDSWSFYVFINQEQTIAWQYNVPNL